MELSLKNREWKEFLISDIFDVGTGANVPKRYLLNGTTPRVSAKEQNNGIVSFTAKSNHKNFRIYKNFISVSFLGSVFYHNYTASLDMKIHSIQLKSRNFNKYLTKFIVIALKRAVANASYGNQISSSDLPNKKVFLPIACQGKPDYKFMENYMRAKEQEKINAYKNYISKRIKELENVKPVVPLKEKDWGVFFIEEVAEINSGKDIYQAKRINGDTPYVSSTAQNNGIGYFVGNTNSTLEANCLSVNRNGSVGYSFYHSYPALFSNDCRKLRLKYPSKHIGIFISQQISRQRKKYGYGYKMGTARLKRQKILLPIKENNEPDYEYMENYMKRLELEKLKKYLDYKERNERKTV